MNITYVSDLDEVDPENDNIDVHVELDDGRVFSLGVDYYFGTPPGFVRLLNRECIEKVVEALVTEDDGRWLRVYGTLHNPGIGQ